jgi:hypothetical protein
MPKLKHGFASYGKGSLTLTGSELGFTPVKHYFFSGGGTWCWLESEPGP